jgi:hypothetical protein
LPPSELPPASYFPTSSPESDDEYSDEEDDIQLDATLYGNRPLPFTTPQVLRWPSKDDSYSDEEEEDEDDEESEDAASDSSHDGSIDMLQHARKLNPELIRLAEREYDSAQAERLAKDIPAGSSAATAGGGSGFNSPESPNKLHSDSHYRRTSSGRGSDGRTQGRSQQSQQVQQSQRGILKRARTSGEGVQKRASKSPKLETSG